MSHQSKEIGSDAVTCGLQTLSELSGVEARSLQKYNRAGLLRPAIRFNSETLYSRENLIELERIELLQALNLSWPDIRNCLGCSNNLELRDELHLQQAMLTEKRKRMGHVIYFLQQAEEVNCDPQSDDWHYLGRVMVALQKLRDPEHFRKLYVEGLKNNRALFAT